jgi:hypothetical protein
MSIYSFAVGTITPGAGTADGSPLTTGTYMAIVGGSATQLNMVDEIYMGGQAASTAPLIMLLRHDSTLGATPATLVTPNSNGPANPLAGILTNPAVGFVAATTQPTPSNAITVAKKNFTFNAFGGIVRANYANTQDRYAIFGNATVTTSELSLSSFTGSTVSTAIGAHILYETM